MKLPERIVNTDESMFTYVKLFYSCCVMKLIISDSLDTNRHLEMEDKLIDAAGGVEGVNFTFRLERRKRSKGMKSSLIIHSNHWL